MTNTQKRNFRKTTLVSDIPWWIRPFYELTSSLVAMLFYTQMRFFEWTCHIEYVNKEAFGKNPNHILSCWHEDLSLFFITHPRLPKPSIWMSYPLWYMRPVHILKKWMGIEKLAFGASGIDGKMALEKVTHNLQKGWNSFVSPDGPKGPLKEVKDGVLLMSMRSHTPIIPIHFDVKKEWRIPSWDRKRYPLPGTKIKVTYSGPVWVTQQNMEESRTLLANRMSTAMDTIA